MKGTITAIKPYVEHPATVPGLRLVKSGGFGFLKDEAGEDRFFLAREVSGAEFSTALEGRNVEFEPQTIAGKGNGLRAIRINVLA